MYTVTVTQFHKDFCKQCVYYGICTEQEKIDCYNIPNERREKLATMICHKPTKVVPKEGDASQCS